MSLGRMALGVILAGAVLGTGWALWLHGPALDLSALPAPPDPPAAAPDTRPPPDPVLPPAAEAEPEAPRFDVARIGTRGMLVAAGRAAPQAEVTLLDGARELGRARADGRGEWVILPTEPLPPGARTLSLQARRPGGIPVEGPDVVVLVVPNAPSATPPAAAVAAGPPTAEPSAPSGPFAVLLPGRGASGTAEAPRLLQVAPGGTGARPGRLHLDVVDYEEGGEIRFAGSAAPGTTLRLYVGGDHLGDALADAAGRWQLTPAGQPALGRHLLRVDQLAAGGGVAARIEVPFQRERLPEATREGHDDLVVQPGHNLWRIARRIYGRGNRYTVIYDANRGQIRDPRLIYPGQVFALPGNSAPAASSLSR